MTIDAVAMTQPNPKLEACEVGLFRLPGVKVNVEEFTPEELEEMFDWAKENHAFIVKDQGLLSWRDSSLRDWFILRWS